MYLLEELFKAEKHHYSPTFNLRIQRSLSWLKQAIQHHETLDLQFLTAWISLNALCAAEPETQGQPNHFSTFLLQLIRQDLDAKISQKVRHDLLPQMQQLCLRADCFEKYWQYKRNKVSQLAWRAYFDAEQQRMQTMFQYQNITEILSNSFQRMLTLQQQMLQGGMSYQSAMHRQQVHAGALILTHLLPIFIQVMLQSAASWHEDENFYPMMIVS